MMAISGYNSEIFILDEYGIDTFDNNDEDDPNNFVGSFIEVRLNSDDDFLKVKETLTRMGIASVKKKTLYQSCHILHKKNSYYIVHFKEMFLLDGKDTIMSEEDIARRNTIANLLDEWGLVQIIDPEYCSSPIMPASTIKIVSFKNKKFWKLESKYNIGKHSSNKRVAR